MNIGYKVMYAGIGIMLTGRLITVTSSGAISSAGFLLASVGTGLALAGISKVMRLLVKEAKKEA